MASASHLRRAGAPAPTQASHAAQRRQLHGGGPRRHPALRRPPPRAAAGAADERGLVDVTPPPSRPPLAEPDPSLDPSVKETLAAAAAAMQTAESTLERLEQLPSARLPTAWDGAAAALRPLAQAAAVAAACAAIHSFGAAARVLGSLAVAAGMAGAGWRRGALDGSGAAAALGVGWATLGASFRGGLTLLAFFFVSSFITRLGDEDKALDEEHRKGGQRNWVQVLCNGVVPAALALAAAALTGGGLDLPVQPLAAGAGRAAAALTGAFLGYYACCCGDTWASELGQLSPEEPRLITTLRPVRRGTNGGVTLLGLAASLAGGLFVGAVFCAAGAAAPAAAAARAAAGAGPAAAQWRLVPLGLAAGLVGSLVDSLLGATVQFSGYNRATGKITSRRGPDVTPISGLPILDNNGVNAVSASVTAALCGLVVAFAF